MGQSGAPPMMVWISAHAVPLILAKIGLYPCYDHQTADPPQQRGSLTLHQTRFSWRDTFTDSAAFAFEQSKLASTWTFLGLSSDLAADNDWFRASLASRSVFVQRFGAQVRAFENVCAHRSFPLRTTDKG